MASKKEIDRVPGVTLGEGTLPVNPFWLTEAGMLTVTLDEFVGALAVWAETRVAEEVMSSQKAMLGRHVVGMFDEQSLVRERHRTTTGTALNA